MYTLKLALSLLHPGPVHLIKVTSNVLITLLITSMVYMIDKIVILNYNFLSSIEVRKSAM